MLPKAARLRSRADFSATTRGRRAARGALVVHLKVTGEGRPARAGFVVSKAVGGAVVRNRVKRRLRHLVAERIGAWEPGTDIVVRALPLAAGRDHTGLGADLDGALASARQPRKHGRERPK
ncbi:ribonuclease P protein component [Phytomonospora endophytica]|uniref:ribonuclease P protein component n=1 Tax=Phytomonospora endophytica TaxID=714109 RepID=UPI00160D88E5|nr:ribonuclease P protein component [Phytomonospora endophytica]GIG64391.1 ribonuclease P protein component [Phytomonospora endophytica]